MEGTSTIAQTTNMNEEIVNAVVAFKSRELVNGSTCQISSLVVYRGREQAVEISHQGFSLTDDGTIKVHSQHYEWSLHVHVASKLM